MNNLTFGQKLLLLRRGKKLSQRALATKLGINFTSILRYEKDQAIANMEIAIKIADLFEISLDYLLRDTEHFGSLSDKELLSLTAEIDKLSDSDREFIKDNLKSSLKKFAPKVA